MTCSLLSYSVFLLPDLPILSGEYVENNFGKSFWSPSPRGLGLLKTDNLYSLGIGDCIVNTPSGCDPELDVWIWTEQHHSLDLHCGPGEPPHPHPLNQEVHSKLYPLSELSFFVKYFARVLLPLKLH